MRTLAKTVLSIILPLLTCAAAQAQVYKWVDGNGVTHYSEKPPETGKAKEVPLHEAGPASGSSPAKAGDPAWKDKERDYRKRKAERDQTAAKAESERAKLEQECRQARNRLADLGSVGKVYETNDKGERVYLSDQQRDALLAARQQEYNQHCN